MLFPAKVAALEFDGDTVRLAAVRIGRGLPQVLELHEAHAQYESPEGRFDALVAAVVQTLDALRTAPAAFVLCAPSQYSIVRILTIPFRGASKVGAAVPFELEPYLAFPLEELLVDHAPIAERPGETDVLAVGLRRALLEDQLAVLSAAGIEVESAGLDAPAITALWQAIHRPGKGLHALLHLRAAGSTLAVVSGKSLLFYRFLSIDADTLRHAPAAVAREVLNCLRGFLAKYETDASVERLHITGIELAPGEIETLTAELRMPVASEMMLAALQPAKGAISASLGDAIPAGNAWEAVIGTAASAATGTFAFDFSKEKQDWRSTLRGVIPHVLVSSCLLAIVLVAWGVYYFINTARNDAQSAEVQAELERVLGEVDALAGQGIKVDIDLFTQPTLLDILRNVTASMQGSGVRIETVQVARPEARSGWVIIEGTDNQQGVPAINAAFEALKQQTMFRFDADPDIRTEGGQTRFRIVAQRPDTADTADTGGAPSP